VQPLLDTALHSIPENEGHIKSCRKKNRRIHMKCRGQRKRKGPDHTNYFSAAASSPPLSFITATIDIAARHMAVAERARRRLFFFLEHELRG
jgi:hypothetical protein